MLYFTYSILIRIALVLFQILAIIYVCGYIIPLLSVANSMINLASWIALFGIVYTTFISTKKWFK